MPRTRSVDDPWAPWGFLPRRTGADAVTLLSVLMALRLGLPSQLVVGALGGLGSPATLLGLLLLGYWFWHRLHGGGPTRGAPANAAAGLFLAAVLASYAAGAARGIASEELTLSTLAILVLAGWLGGFLLASDGVTDIDRRRILVGRLAVFGAIFAGFGLLQFLTDQAWVDKLSIPGLVRNTQIYSVSLRGGFVRPFGTAIHPIEFGSVIAMLLPLTIVHGMLASPRRWFVWVPALVTMLAAEISLSRSAIVCVIVGLVLLWPALTRIQRLVGGVAVMVLGIVVFVAVPGMVATITSLFGGSAGDSSVTSRVDSYGMAVDLLGRYPVFGRGFGTFLPRYRIFDNQYLLALVETGVIGTLAMVTLWAVPVFGVVGVIRRSAAGAPLRLLATGLLASSVVGAIGLALFDGFGFPMMPAVWFVVLGLAGACYRLDPTTSS